MHKIDGPGATVGNEWTEGNPAGGIPATTVTDDFMNTIQRELVEVVEGAGLTLNKPDDTQVRQGIQALIASGGGSGSDNVQQAILNNQAVAISIGTLAFNKANEKAGAFLFDINRQTDTQDVQETGTAYVAHDPKDDIWRISPISGLDDAGVTLSITVGGQIQYVSTDLTGTSYTGTIRIIDVKKVPQTI